MRCQRCSVYVWEDVADVADVAGVLDGSEGGKMGEPGAARAGGRDMRWYPADLQGYRSWAKVVAASTSGR